MFDEQKLILNIKPPNTVRDQVADSFDFCGFVFNPIFRNGILKHYESSFNNLHLRIINDRLIIANSIHKFVHGNNYTDFTAYDVKCAVSALQEAFKNDFKESKITKTSFSVNIECDQTQSLIDNLICFDGKEMFPMLGKSTVYGKFRNLSQNKIKAYSKTLENELHYKQKIDNQLFRLEDVTSQMRRILTGKNSISLVSLNDYCNKDVQVKVMEHILRTFDQLTFSNKLTTEQIVKNNLNLRDWTLLLRFEQPDIYKLLGPDSYRKDKSKYKELQSKLNCSEVNLNDIRDRIEHKLNYLIDTR